MRDGGISGAGWAAGDLTQPGRHVETKSDASGLPVPPDLTEGTDTIAPDGAALIAAIGNENGANDGVR